MPFGNHPVAPEGAAPPSAPPGNVPGGACTSSGFERPSYFAGHLLTDADLTLEQHYLREKNKLHNRALHGHGIVCGLRLSCDRGQPRCVLIEKGLALDVWGNDLVLPEATSFDVVERLVTKRLVFPGPPAAGSSGPESSGAGRSLRQSFYITLSYHEEAVDFAAPLMAAGPSTLGPCEPTRMREMVCIDVSDRPPVRPDASDALRHRLELCFKLFSDGAFAHALRTHRRALADLVTSGVEVEADYQQIFRELQGYLLLYLRQHPDKYDAAINDEIRQIRVPDIRRSGGLTSQGDVDALRDAFSSLLALAWRHAVHGALGELVPCCPEPSEASRILLGTVIVENERVVQVCNGPRSYVWSPANFPSVLMAMTLGGLAFPPENGPDAQTDQAGPQNIGLRKFNFDLACFLRWSSVSAKASSYAGTELLRWIDELKQSAQQGFDFTNPCHFSANLFKQMNERNAENHLKDAHVSYRIKDAPPAGTVPPLFAVLQAAGLASGEQPVVLEVSDGSVSNASVRHADLVDRIQHLQRQIDSLKTQLEQRGQSQR